MSEQQKPRKGDKVRVTYEAIWDQDRGSHYWLRDQADGTTAAVPASATVELIELADDPSKDPIGTVRHERHDDDSGHSIWLCTQDRHGRRGWFCVYSTAVGNQGGRMDDDEVAGLPVVDALLGTPAAEPESAERSAGCQNYWPVETVTGEDIDRWHEQDEARLLLVHPSVWKSLADWLHGMRIKVDPIRLAEHDGPTTAYAMSPMWGSDE